MIYMKSLIKNGTFIKKEVSFARELAPLSEDWYYVRAASIARKVYLKKGTGVGALQCVYGSAYRKGVRTEHFRRAAAGHILRHILQNLEKIGVVETLAKGGRGIKCTVT